MRNSFKFLTEIAIDPKKYEQFEHNCAVPLGVTELSEIQQSAHSNAMPKLPKSWAGELATDELVAIMGNCILGDPGPDPSPDPDPPPDGAQSLEQISIH